MGRRLRSHLAVLLLLPAHAAADAWVGWDLACDSPRLELSDPATAWQRVEGFEPQEESPGSGRMLAPGASLLLLSSSESAPRTLVVEAHTEGRTASLAASLNGYGLGAKTVRRQSKPLSWSLPAEAVRRGPNVLRLEQLEAGSKRAGKVTLVAIEIRPRTCGRRAAGVVPVDPDELLALDGDALVVIPARPSGRSRLELSFSSRRSAAAVSVICYGPEKPHVIGTLTAQAPERASASFRLDDACTGLALLGEGPGRAANLAARLIPPPREPWYRGFAFRSALAAVLLLAVFALARLVAGRSRLVEWAPLVVLGLWVVFWAPRGHFSGDFGVKLAQAHSLWESGYSSRSLASDDELDPGREFFPFRPPFVRQVDGAPQGVYSVVFAALSAPFIASLHMDGTIVLALLGSCLTALALFRMFDQLDLHPLTRLAVMASSLLATPILLYSSQLSEYAVVTGLVLLALALVWEGRPAPAGLLGALAATFHPQGYSLLASLGLVVFLVPETSLRSRIAAGLRYLGGSVPVLLAYWTYNLITADTWDPLVATTRRDSVWDVVETTRYLLIGWVDGGWLWFAPWALAFAVGLLPTAWRPRSRLAAHLAVAVAIAAVAWMAQRDSLAPVQAGLFSLTPLAAYGLLAGPWRRRFRAPWLFAMSYLAQVLAFDRGFTAAGLEFGSRHLMPLVPVLILLAGAVTEEDRQHILKPRALALLPGLGLLVLTGGSFARSLPPALEKARQAETAVARIAATPTDVVITNRWWEAPVLAPLLLESKRIYFSGGQTERLLRRLAASGARSVAFVSPERLRLDLGDGFEARAAELWRGPLEIQLVVIEKKPEIHRGKAVPDADGSGADE